MSESFNISRPNEKHNREVLQSEEEFLKVKGKPCVTVVPSRDAEAKSPLKSKRASVHSDDGELPEDAEVSNPVLVDVVVERNVHGSYNPPSPCHDLFVKTKKKSVFLQRLNKDTKQKDQSASGSSQHKPNVPEAHKGSFIVDGSGLNIQGGQAEAQKLHYENTEKIAAMSKEEILCLQKELYHSLGEDKIKFLKSKRRASALLTSSPARAPIRDVRSTENLSGDPLETTLKCYGNKDQDAVLLENLSESVTPPPIPKRTQPKLTEQLAKDLPFDELPIDPEEAKQWVNMGKLEKDKLTWMTLLPMPKTVDSKSKRAARFDFKGRLLPSDADIPTQMGLHHHSADPEAPGYSIEELFLLARSAFHSQRVTALETLAHILRNYWLGIFDGCFDTPLLGILLQAGLAPLLRWALDDGTLSSVSAALLCIRHLLVSEVDEMCLDRAFCLIAGHFQPFLNPEIDDATPVLDELTDSSIIKMDVIAGFLRMDLLPRCSYIMNVLNIPENVYNMNVEIFTRIARHSKASAKQVVNFPGLFENIFHKLIPTECKFFKNETEVESHYALIHTILKFIRVVSCADIEIAAHIIEAYPLVNFMKQYLAFDHCSEEELKTVAVKKLIIENLRLWQTLLTYGCCTEIYEEMKNLFFRQFMFCSSLSINSGIRSNIIDYDYASHLFKAFETLFVALTTDKECVPDQTGSSKVLHHDVLIKDILQPCVKRWLREFSIGPTNQPGQLLLMSCLNCMSVVCQKSILTEPDSVTAVLKDIGKHLCKCVQSREFSYTLSHMVSSSILLCKDKHGSVRDVEVLPSLGSILWNSDIVPLFLENSAFPLIGAVFRFLLSLAEFDEVLHDEVIDALNIIDLRKYLDRFSLRYRPFAHWFDKCEIYCLYHYIQVYHLMYSQDKRSLLTAGPKFLHEIATRLILCFEHPYKPHVKWMMQEILFNPIYLSVQRETLDVPFESTWCATICRYYCSVLLPSMEREELSKYFQYYLCPNSLSFESSWKVLSGANWPFIPIWNHYVNSKSSTSSEVSATERTEGISHCLEWIYQNGLTMFSTEDLHLSARFVYLCMVFLIDSETYLNEMVRDHLELCLFDVLNSRYKLDLVKMRIKDFPTAESIFHDLLVQFCAVSYGDVLFSDFISVFIQQRFPNSWKSMLFYDHEEVLDCFSVPLTSLIIPLENFLFPVEMDEQLLIQYFQGVRSEKLNYKRCPLLFLMAVHHLHHFLHLYLLEAEEGKKHFQASLRKTLEDSKTRVTSKYILYYDDVNKNSELGFSFKG